MDFPSLIRFSSWLIPIPFMFLYKIKEDRYSLFFEWLSDFSTLWTILLVSAFSLLTFTQINIGFKPELISFYIIMSFFCFKLFNKKYDVPQALSIAVLLTFSASMIWEIPYFIYTIYLRGYIDQSMPLHILYAFPLAFLVGKISLKRDMKNFLLFSSGMMFSTLIMFVFIFLGGDMFWTYINPQPLHTYVEIGWYISRIVVFTVLYIIFYRGQLRRKEIAQITNTS